MEARRLGLRRGPGRGTQRAEVRALLARERGHGKLGQASMLNGGLGWNWDGTACFGTLIYLCYTVSTSRGRTLWGGGLMLFLVCWNALAALGPLPRFPDYSVICQYQ